MFDDKQIGVFMRVYRNESSMHKAIQSVLGQTHRNFKYYILVSRATKDIVNEYAEKDDRIVVYDGKPKDGFKFYAKHIACDGNDYLTTIDADDWYGDTYLEDLLYFAETNKTDVVACCCSFVNSSEQVVGKREQHDMIWTREESSQVLAQIYGFFRPIWGKLYSSDVILKYNDERLLDEEEYGGYGGDTMFVFNVLYEAERVGICNKLLYNYRISETGGSYTLQKGRLESDAILFYYIVDFLKAVSSLSEYELRFLFHVYANALIDTTRLLLNAKLSERERAEKLLYIYNHTLTEELFLREYKNGLQTPEMSGLFEYGEKCYQLIFSDLKKCDLTEMTQKCYWKVFNTIHAFSESFLCKEEFSLLLKDRRCMDLFRKKEYEQLVLALFELLPMLKVSETKNCLHLLKRCVSGELVKMLLFEKKFALRYQPLILMVNQSKWQEALQWLHNKFAEEAIPYQAEVLAELWVNVAALTGDASEFVLGKQVKVEMLLTSNQKEAALLEYKELEEMGVTGENMTLLKDYLEKGETE